MCKTSINVWQRKQICFVSNMECIFRVLTQALPTITKCVSQSQSFLLPSLPLFVSSSCPSILKVHVGLASCFFFFFSCSSVPWAETNTPREVHTCPFEYALREKKKKKNEWKPLCAFLASTVHGRTILLMTSYSQQLSVTFLRFTNLHWFPFPAWFCVSVLTSWMSVSPLSIQISCWYSTSCVLLDISNIW